MGIPISIQDALHEWVGDIISFEPSSGGCINNGGKLISNRGLFFLKWNSKELYPGLFQAEAKGLRLLRSADAIHIPEVVSEGHGGDYQFLLMEWIAPGIPNKNYATTLGEGLAKLHACKDHANGLDHDNYIGSLPQINSRQHSWISFFRDQRLLPQFHMATSKGKLDNESVRQFEFLLKKLDDMLLEESPSLLHGDLWNGNVITTSTGEPCLIDPAVYFGCREMDLAMTRLFGGFDPDFYKSYDRVLPLEKGYMERLDIYNLYPILVHVNLFGGAYLTRFNSILKKFS